jgi:hypothetical protein
MRTRERLCADKDKEIVALRARLAEAEQRVARLHEAAREYLRFDLQPRENAAYAELRAALADTKEAPK